MLGIKAEKKSIDSIHESLVKLDTPFRNLLLSLYQEAPQKGLDNQLHQLDGETKISIEQGLWLYEFCISKKPASTLEIGMAYGYSTLFFLAAAAKNHKGQHTAIDPFQKTHWKGIGLSLAMECTPKMEGKAIFQLIEDYSDRTASDIIRRGHKFDIVFIDGNHRFDDVLVDFYLYAQVCTVGGWIILDDMWMPSIKTVVNFIRSNRKDFIELPTNISNIAVFRKVGDDTRKWDEFSAFPVAK